MTNQKGYTSLFIIALFAAIALAMFSLYDVGQIASNKQKTQNTADAVAYSTVNIVTRDMNFIAYTNRAMATNQVAIGQMVALSSWIHMADITADNYDRVASIIQRVPYVGTVIGSILRAFTYILKQATDAFLPIIDGAARYGIPLQDFVNFTLSSLQRGYHGIAMFNAINVYEDVALKNDPDIERGMAYNGARVATVLEAFRDEYQSYNVSNTRRDRKTQRRFDEFANVVKDSRDRFNPQRKYRYWDFEFLFLRIAFDRRGGTDFYMQRDSNRQMRWNWTSMDTHSFWWGTWDWWDGWDDDELIPLGWGAAHAKHRNMRGGNRFNYYWEQSGDRRQNQWHHDGNYARRARTDRAWGDAWRNRRAAWGVYRPAPFSGNNRRDIENNLANAQGLQTFHDFRHDDATDKGPDLVVLITKNRSNIRTMQTIDDGDNNMTRADRFKIESEGQMPGDRLFALSKAESYFSRPQEETRRRSDWQIRWGRGDGLREYGNLYNPFWLTRLTDLSANDKRIATVTLGIQ
ncbi:MAG: hypothetical protein HWE13_01830 [Gammaproteobacteria bacterium]|nr:hypothetical protein [Gammaproteobacteria bacterium]